MKSIIRSLVVLAGILLLFTACKSSRQPAFGLYDKEGTITVACIGDSITFGAGVENRETNSYPAVLGRMLGSRFAVRNFGVSGATLLKKGNLPYWSLPEMNAVSDSKPDVIIIKLGTNDTKPENWTHKDEFARDYRDFLAHFLALPNKPKIFVCLPVPVYQTQWGINDETLFKEVIPLIEKSAQEAHVPIIDLYDALSNRPELFPDKVHPNAEGAALIARTVYTAIVGR